MPRTYTRTPLEVRFWAKVQKTDGCWTWTGARSGVGYGVFNLGPRGAGFDVAHRVSYRLLIGPIPKGLHLDHLCRNTMCVRPDHLEPVTPRENVMRSHAPNVLLSHRGKCARGHDASESYRRKDTNRVVSCRACRREDYKASTAARIRSALPEGGG